MWTITFIDQDLPSRRIIYSKYCITEKNLRVICIKGPGSNLGRGSLYSKARSAREQIGASASSSGAHGQPYGEPHGALRHLPRPRGWSPTVGVRICIEGAGSNLGRGSLYSRARSARENNGASASSSGAHGQPYGESLAEPYASSPDPGVGSPTVVVRICIEGAGSNLGRGSLYSRARSALEKIEASASSSGGHGQPYGEPHGALRRLPRPRGAGSPTVAVRICIEGARPPPAPAALTDRPTESLTEPYASSPDPWGGFPTVALGICIEGANSNLRRGSVYFRARSAREKIGASVRSRGAHGQPYGDPHGALRQFPRPRGGGSPTVAVSVCIEGAGSNLGRGSLYSMARSAREKNGASASSSGVRG